VYICTCIYVCRLTEVFKIRFLYSNARKRNQTGKFEFRSESPSVDKEVLRMKDNLLLEMQFRSRPDAIFNAHVL